MGQTPLGGIKPVALVFVSVRGSLNQILSLAWQFMYRCQMSGHWNQKDLAPNLSFTTSDYLTLSHLTSPQLPHLQNEGNCMGEVKQCKQIGKLAKMSGSHMHPWSLYSS